MYTFEKEGSDLTTDGLTPDPRSPVTLTWNPWHGCTRVSPGCRNCYMFQRDESVGKNPSIVRKTQSFDLPARKIKKGIHKGRFKVPSGSHFFTCFSSDFFHPDADAWRDEAWQMMMDRPDCTFFMLTKRPGRMSPAALDGAGPRPDEPDPAPASHITIGVTCEDQYRADHRLPQYLELPLSHRHIMVEPMLGRIDLRKYLATGLIEAVSVGGESGPNARACDYAWVLDLHIQKPHSLMPSQSLTGSLISGRF